MAGVTNGEFRELISPFLREKMAQVAARSGLESPDYLALALQYQRDPREEVVLDDQSSRHYDAVLDASAFGQRARGVERIYRQTLLVEPTMRCAAHCRWCIRADYVVESLSPDDLDDVARLAGSAALRDDITEILVTGGDPLMAPALIGSLVASLKRHAPNVTTLRIGTRVPFQDPARVNETFLGTIAGAAPLRVEVGLHANHPVEFWPEAVAAIDAMRAAGATLYNQHPVLAGVNDDADTLVRLYAALREHRIEPHYLFHAVPMRGMEHHRTTVDELLQLHREVTTSGRLSGRTKPKPALLTDVGKVVLTEGSIVARDEARQRLLVRTAFSLDDRVRWNPSSSLPASASVGAAGRLMVWYQDKRSTDVPPIRIEVAAVGAGHA